MEVRRHSKSYRLWQLAITIKNENRGLPWWLSGKESTCQCRRRRFNPWSGRIPHAAEQLSPWTTTVESALESRNHNCWAWVAQLLTPTLPRACVPHQEKTPHWEACTPRLESSPYSPQLEKSLHSNKDWAQLKIKINTNYFFKRRKIGTSLVVQWLRLHTSNAGSVGWLSGQEAKIPHATGHGRKFKKGKYSRIGGDRLCLLNRASRESLSNSVRKWNCVYIWRRNIPSRGNSRYKGPWAGSVIEKIAKRLVNAKTVRERRSGGWGQKLCMGEGHRSWRTSRALEVSYLLTRAWMKPQWCWLPLWK